MSLSIISSRTKACKGIQVAAVSFPLSSPAAMFLSSAIFWGNPPFKTDSLIVENNMITMRDRKINFRSLALLDQGIFLIMFDQFMNVPLLSTSKLAILYRVLEMKNL